MYSIITENDESKWNDKTGLLYHYPSKYQRFLQQGTQVVYYKGKITDKKFESKRLSREPHYFGIGTIGDIYKEPTSTNLFAQIVGFKIFNKAVPFKIDSQPVERIPVTRVKNYWRDAVRPVDESVYNRIIELAELQPSQSTEGTDNGVIIDDSFITVVYEGGKQYVYSTIYERSKTLRDLAIKYHGYTCKVCNANYKEIYGDWGEGFIHVHHLKPISTSNGQVAVDPRTDMTVLCASCHSMIHRRKHELLSVDDLKKRLVRNSRLPKR
jgi:5-methylcytosine-specific restriction protein A